ncbi:MAG: S41 family peptidase, partial [Paludibacteraceae bacterium]|nr:S41 family peptidase [Paludibacteraceae bacterium]
MKRILFTILFFVPTIAFSQVKTAEIDASMGVFFDVMRMLDVYYVDTVNYKDVVETAITQMLQKTDPYTVYYPSSKDDDLRMMTTGKYGGIGAIISQREYQVNDSTKERWACVADPYEGMPAQLAGVWAGDRILSINGIEMKNKSVKQVSDQLRGASETRVKLVLERYGVAEPIEKEILRKEIKLPAIPYYDAFDGIGYISLTEFTEHSSQHFKRTLDELKEQKNIQGLILDLRNNGGGIIDEAIRIVSNFVPRGTLVVETKGKIESSKRTYTTTQTPSYLDFPLVIIMNKNSASASEIVAGSLQDLGRATIVGERSFGKGLVQSVRTLQHEGGHLKVTTAH